MKKKPPKIKMDKKDVQEGKRPRPKSERPDAPPIPSKKDDEKSEQEEG